MFGKKKTVSKEELQTQIFQNKIELRRLMDKYETLLQKELRIARDEKAAGVARPSNYERIKTIAALMATTQAAYDDMDNISTTDELNRTTNELAKVLKNVNAVSDASQRANVGGISRGLRDIRVNETVMTREYEAQIRAVGKATGDAKGYDAQLQAILDEALGEPKMEYAAPVTENFSTAHAVRDYNRPMTDEELEAEMDIINRHLNSVLDEF